MNSSSRPLALLLLAGATLALVTQPACGPSTGRPRDAVDGGTQGRRDPNRDYDGDGLAMAQGDCNDDDPAIRPGADELCDRRDNNCDNMVDEICDVDGDGATPKAGDCNDSDKLVGPGAVEVKGDSVDNNCDGQIDEEVPGCDNQFKPGDPRGVAGAIGVCSPWLVEARFAGTAPDPRAYAVKVRFGDTYTPKQGSNFVMFSTGIAADKKDMSFVRPQTGTDFKKSAMNPLPMNTKNNVCGKDTVDPLDVKDYIELHLKLKVPINARSFSFNLMFVSAEYPEFVGSKYNDKFLALLESQSYSGNISFDAKKNPITVNVGFFDVCNKAQKICDGSLPGRCSKPILQLSGTGYEDDAILEGTIGGGTGWLTTTAPVTPGETATLRLILFDEGDGIYDSAVILDNFQWQLDAAMEPMTIG